MASSVAPTLLENLPGLHPLHSSAPATALNVPAAHSTHVPPASPDEPALQVHAANAALPAGASACAGHDTHAASVDAPSATEYFPAEQSSQGAGPVAILNLPGTHIAHAAPFEPDEPALHLQAVLDTLPAGDDASAGQSEQLVAAIVSENLPAPHSAQSAPPSASLNLPATQCVQGPPFDPVYPLTHKHSALPASLSVLAGHGVHSADPDSALYVDARHRLQLPGGPVSPGGQTPRQSDASSLPGADSLPSPQGKHWSSEPAPTVPEYLPAGQAVQTCGATAPTASEYLPSTQLVHCALPLFSSNFPAGHNVQAAPSDPNEPLLHVQLATAVLPAAELECSGHDVQVDSSIAPVAAENLPAAQSMHPASWDTFTVKVFASSSETYRQPFEQAPSGFDLTSVEEMDSSTESPYLT